MSSSSATSSGKPDASRQWQVFICYRQDDGKDAAAWLHRQLHKLVLPRISGDDAVGPTLAVYFDQAAPAADDWTKIHRPALEKSVAFLFVCSPAAQHRQGEDDWVHRELEWWLGNREAAPIIVDPLDRGERYLPERIKVRWPNAQRVSVRPEDWQALAADARAEIAQRTVERIVGGIRLSAGQSLREDYERELARRRTLEQQRRYLIGALVLAAVALGGVLRLGQIARQQARSLRASGIVGQAAVADEPLTRALLLAELDGSIEPENGRRLARDVSSTAVPVFALGLTAPRVEQFALSPDGHQLATATDEGDVEVRSIDGVGRPIVLAHNTKTVNQLAFSPDGRQLAAASNGRRVSIWTLDGSQQPRVLEHSKVVSSVAFRPDSNQLVTHDAGYQLHLWSLKKGTEVTSAPDIERIWMSPTGGHLLTLAVDGGADLWPLADGIAKSIRVVPERRVFPRWSNQVSFSPRGDQVALALNRRLGNRRFHYRARRAPRLPRSPSGSHHGRLLAVRRLPPRWLLRWRNHDLAAR
jgi:hypothetical protein